MERLIFPLKVFALFITLNEGLTPGMRGSYDWKISVVSEVLSGPLRGGTLVVHLDDAIPRDVQQAIMALDAVQETPHVTLSLGVNETWWPDQQVPTFIHGYSVLHLVLFLTHPTKFLQSVWLNWKPRNLLLFSLAPSSDASILNHEVFNSVQKLALITELSDEVHGRPHTMGVYTLQPFSSGTPKKFLGEWNPQRFAREGILFIDRFPSFQGYTFHLATWMTDPPYLYQKNTTSGTLNVGITVNMLDAMASKLDFKYTMTVRPPDSKWGRIENGSWVGLLGMVHSKEKNFTVNNFHHSNERLRDFDVSSSYWMEGLPVYLLKPEPLPAWLSVRRPFQPLVWAAVAATFGVVVCLMTLQERVGGQPFLGGAVTTWLYLQRGVFGQGVPAVPQAVWQRMFLGVWYIYCLLVSAYYTSNLIAVFTSLAYPPRIQTLQQLVDSKYRVGMADYGTSLLEAMSEPECAVEAQLSRKMELFSKEEEGVAALAAGTHAFINNPGFGFFKLGARYEVFNWYTVKEHLLSGHLSWHFPKHTPWKPKFDQVIQSLVEGGFVQYWYTVETEGAPGQVTGQGQQGSQARPSLSLVLSLDHLQGVFYILVFGWAASGAAFLLELLRHRCSRR